MKRLLEKSNYNCSYVCARTQESTRGVYKVAFSHYVRKIRFVPSLDRKKCVPTWKYTLKNGGGYARSHLPRGREKSDQRDQNIVLSRAPELNRLRLCRNQLSFVSYAALSIHRNDFKRTSLKCLLTTRSTRGSNLYTGVRAKFKKVWLGHHSGRNSWEWKRSTRCYYITELFIFYRRFPRMHPLCKQNFTRRAGHR